MSLKPGFKQTEVAVIPDDWEEVRLGDIGYIFGGLTGKSSEDFGTGNANYITFMNVITNVVSKESGVEKVSVGAGEHQSAVLPGDVLFNGSSETPEEVGFGSVVPEALAGTYLNSFCFGFRPNKDSDLDSKFFAYLTRSSLGREIIRPMAQGSTRYNLAKTNLLNGRFPRPPVKEQKAIAEALSDVDALINSLEALLTKKRNIKTGVMQELLTGRTRLPGFSYDWQEVRLGAICDFVPTIALSRAQLEADEGVMCIHYGDIHTKFSDRLDIANAMLPKSETLLVARVPRLKVGDLVLADASEDLVGVGKSVEIVSLGSVEVVGGLHTVVLRPKVGNFAPGFAGLLQHTPRFKEQSRVLAAGLKVYGLSKTSISKILVFVPPVKEQKAIAAVLSDIDDEIEALEKRLAKTRDLKQGMAQELLTGRTRLV